MTLQRSKLVITVVTVFLFCQLVSAQGDFEKSFDRSTQSRQIRALGSSPGKAPLVWSVPKSAVEHGLASRNRRKQKRLQFLQPLSPLFVGVELLVEGRPVRLSSWRHVTFPRIGTKYSIRITNRGTRRIVALVAVDGLSVMDRRPARLSGSGYIITPGKSYTITGWRLDQRRVKAFNITSPGKSEAAKQGLTNQVGLISVTAIGERVSYRARQVSPREASRQQPSWRGTTRDRSPAGTGAGREMESRVRRVKFRRSQVISRLHIRYSVAEKPAHRADGNVLKTR